MKKGKAYLVYLVYLLNHLIIFLCHFWQYYIFTMFYDQIYSHLLRIIMITSTLHL